MAEPTVAEFLWKTGSFLLLTAWLLGSGWVIVVIGQEIYADWGTWRTRPIPDKRAIKHIVGYITVIGLNLVFLWLAVAWFGQ